MDKALLALPFGLLVGLLLGLVGGGGSILAVPVLVALDQSPQAATSESLLIVGLTALIGAIDGGRAGRLRLHTGLVFALAGVLGSLPGTAVNRQIGSHALLLGFSVVLLAAGAAMLRRRPAAEPARDTRSGFLTGLFGVGGGFIIAPALVTMLGLPLQAAVGTLTARDRARRERRASRARRQSRALSSARERRRRGTGTPRAIPRMTTASVCVPTASAM